LEQDYYDQLVVKRILFLIVNSFNSLFYLAFYASYLNSELCLQAVRTQLLTLFFTQLFITNFLDLALPIIYTYVTDKMTNYEENKFVEDQIKKNMEDPINVTSSSNVVENVVLGPQASIGNVQAPDNNNEEEEDLKVDNEPPKPYKKYDITVSMWDDINTQIDLSPSPDVLYSTSESIIQYGYIMLFSFVFPIMPVLGIVTNYFSLRIDYYNVITCQRPVPLAANGIGVWKHVLATFSTTAIYTNAALLVFRTNLITNLMHTTSMKYKIVFFFVATLVLLFVQFLIRFSIPNVPAAVQDALEREDECERYLYLDATRNSSPKQP